MTLLAGSRLGRYEIPSPLGAGGMGEVYCARDTRLSRTVAVRVSRSVSAEGRFERDVKVELHYDFIMEPFR